MLKSWDLRSYFKGWVLGRGIILCFRKIVWFLVWRMKGLGVILEV